MTTTWLHNGSSDYSCAFTKPIYCMSDPSGAADTTPLPIGFPMTVTYNSGETLDSNEITVLGITSPMTVTLTGSQGSPVLKINNVAAAGNTALVNLGDKVKITMTAPTVLGTQHTATLMYGSFLETWKLGYADSSKVAHVFVSSKVFSTSSGVNNLDNSCTTAAESAGLGGTWKALVATESDNATDRAPWNWGSLKLVDNSTLIATSWSDLWDGTLLHPINMDENLTPNLAIEVETGFTVNGIKITDRTMGSWSGGFSSYGLTGHSDSRWANNSPGYTSLANAYFYCFEDTSAAPDTTPTDLRLAYKVFQDPSTTVTSATYVVRGITAGSVPFTLTDLSAGGAAAATYSINGGASQNAGTPSYVKGGDGITLSMTTPATTNSSYKATFTVGDSVAIPWRVWTKGVTSGTLIKRMFVSNAMYVCNYGGLTGLNNQCQSMATGKGLSGTWVALVSGVPYDEPNFAINRVGYNWTELWTIDASGNPANRVLSAPNLWNNSTLESAPNVDVNGATISTTTFVATNTEFDGKNLDTNTTACNGFASLNFELFYRGQSSGSLANSLWLNQDANGKNDTSHRLYCIEQ